MNGFALAGSVFGLGVAGLDPFGALMVVPALAAGAKRRIVMWFFGMAALCTVLTGLVVGESVQHVSAWLARLAVPAPVRLIAQAAAAAALGAWAAVRWARRGAPKREKASVLVGPVAMALAGALWGVSAVTDPSFLALVAVDAGVESLPVSTAVFAGWFVISQAPLCLVVLALVTGKDTRPVRGAVALARRLEAPAGSAVTLLLAAGAVLLALNALSYPVAGRFWPL